MYNLVSPSSAPRHRLICCKSMSMEAGVAHWLRADRKSTPTTKVSEAGTFADAEVYSRCSVDVADLVPVPTKLVRGYSDELSLKDYRNSSLLAELQAHAGGAASV